MRLEDKTRNMGSINGGSESCCDDKYLKNDHMLSKTKNKFGIIRKHFRTFVSAGVIVFLQKITLLFLDPVT